MLSQIITSPDKDKRLEYIKNYCQELGINAIDITIIEKETALKQNLNSIGIEEIKNLQKKLFLKPFNSPMKAIILDDAQLLTIEAQNAMLKILEEPPDNTIIILSADSKEPFLPTIISRCKIIELNQNRQKISEKETLEFKEFIERLPKMPVSEKFKKAEALAKDKEKALVWIEEIILILREDLLTNNSGQAKYYLNTIKSFQKTHTLLKSTNVSPRFALETTLLLIN